MQFAKYLCNLLTSEYEAKKFKELMIAASPHFLGDLRNHLDAACRNVLTATIDKDLLHVSGAEIGAHFKERKAALRAAGAV